MSEAAGRLWGALANWFEDDSFHAGPDISLNDLTAGDVERLWQHLLDRAEPIAPD